MYQKPVPLKSTDHADLRLLPVRDYTFACGELTAPIVVDEIADVAREYPIVFPSGAALPVALLGVEKGANAYVATDGRWLAHYIPAHIRHYPLAMARVPVTDGVAGGDEGRSEQRRLVVLVDEASPVVSLSEGDRFFASDGQLSAALQVKVRSLERLRTRARVTRRLVQAIEQAGLLREQTIRIQGEGARVRQVTGVRLINEQALNQLDAAAFNTLRSSGALPLVYAALLSWANFRQGPIGRSHPLPAAPAPVEDDVIRFN